MMQPSPHVVVSAKILDAAVEKALWQLKGTRAEADVEVLLIHSNGFLDMFGCCSAQDGVTFHDRGAIALKRTFRLLQLINLDADAELVSSVTQAEINIKAVEPNALIGRHGQVLDALQTPVGNMTDRLTTDRTSIRPVSRHFSTDSQRPPHSS